ncbi:hypothetical protein [Capnocytophaga catalasegens]|uniref:Lipoprotein n=1 Tax=Capnocytophaga catalasegens TaxID=1004260 RepID=A0AAV5B047_9FLAO|nr:hypothetical protein [Capnocytophaga catalasegens]GIZ16642.1 hypothetical protein RCZ03_26420 [Capnocytophaga catalasegens]GJM51246.1 hypothetical protein RCZ15_22190 [Capnocytophaga catalasegens]GJM54193.1 hypothetical protein RCZ16_25090 [Capnocytophaga catalasegens]
MKRIIVLFIVLFFASCYNINKNIEIQQVRCLNCNMIVSFSITKKGVKQGGLGITNRLIIKNPTLNFVDIDFYYFRNGDSITYPSEASLITVTDEDYFKKTGKRNRIRLSPLSKKEIIYQISEFNTEDSIHLTSYSESLNQYISRAHPFEQKNKYTKEVYKSNKTLIYEEPFSEFKSKNPELLEFLTKGDSIELEVISPVKQKYKFKAEW